MDAVRLDRPSRSAAARVLTEAFWHYPATVHLLAGERRRGHVLPRYLEAECAVAQAHGTLLGVIEAGEVLGVAACTPPEGTRGAPLHWGHVALLLPALPWAVPTAREALRAQGAYRSRRPPDRHLYLQVIGVRPNRQGRGIGRRLLAAVLDDADQRRAGCYLTTTEPGNVAFYERAGFEVLDTWRPTPSWPVTWALWRDPA